MPDYEADLSMSGDLTVDIKRAPINPLVRFFKILFYYLGVR